MTLEEAIEILEANGYSILSEDFKSTLGKVLGIGALAATTAMGNSNVPANPVKDPSFGKNTTVHLHDRYNLESDKYGVPKTYKLKNNKSPYKISFKNELELTKKKILATPDSMLRKYGKDNIDLISKYMVNTANKYNIDVDILLAIAGTETNFDNNRKSGAGAIGMMQITKTTAMDSHVRLQGKDKKSFDFDDFKQLKTNIDNAGRIVAELSKRHANVIEMIYAAYNGGFRQATNYRSHVSKAKFDRSGKPARPLAKETKQSVERCMALYKVYTKVQNQAKI